MDDCTRLVDVYGEERAVGLSKFKVPFLCVFCRARRLDYSCRWMILRGRFQLGSGIIGFGG